MYLPILSMPLLLAAAAPQAAPAGSMLYPMGTMFLLLAIMYFLILRPQQVKAKEHRDLISRLKVGDQVVTTGGIYGEIAGVDEASMMIKVANGVEIRIVRSAVSTVLSPAAEASERAEGKSAKKR